MSLKELDRIAATARGSVTELPNEFDGEVTGTEMLHDEQYNREVLNATIRIDDTDYTISYKPLHTKALAKALRELDVETFSGRFHFVKKDFGIGFARPIPTAVL